MRGFFVLRRIDWEAPTNILEKIIEYEAVHAIDGWDDLRRRIEPEDRLCFGFFHPMAPDEPLIFVEIALCKGIPASVQDILAKERRILAESEADTAVFYSISNSQQGLGGISFGNLLIKQVIESLSRDLPNLNTYVTLSPLPGFRAWLERQVSAEQGSRISEILAAVEAAEGEEGAKPLEPVSNSLRYLAALYLVEEKRANGLPFDPVARFHLGNGALIHDILPMADISANGIRQSCGVMANYLYDLEQLEANHMAFEEKRAIACARTINRILKAGLPDRKTRKAANA
nr:malonyl-CoA decarboxylase family protein [Flavimaribacter sediminis]